mgnify:FL=1
MILIDVTYANWSPADIDHGETVDQGFIFQDEPISFKSLVELMRGYESASNFPVDANCWLSSFNTDFKSGVETVHNLHFSYKNKTRYKKYWWMALKAAGFI